MASRDEFLPGFLRSKAPPPDVPEEEEEEAGANRTSAKPVISVTFVDGAGVPHQFAYSHLYRITVEGRTMVVEFSDHVVRVEGQRLFAPVRDCLMRRLGHHKAEFVEVHPRPEFAEGEVVERITVAARKPQG